MAKGGRKGSYTRPPTRVSPRKRDHSDDQDETLSESESQNPPKRSNQNREPEDPERVSKILDLKSKIGDQRVKIRDQKTKIQDLENTIASGASENQDLRLAIQELKKKSKNKSGVALNEGFLNIVENRSRSTVWRGKKFIAGENELDLIMHKILKSCDHGRDALDGLEGDALDAMVRSYSLTYGQIINDTINGKRSQVQTSIWKVVKARKLAGKRVPKPSTMLQIIRRKGLRYTIEEGKTEPTRENKEEVDSNREVFDWYSDELIGKVVPYADWGPAQKYHGHLSTYGPPDKEGEVYVPANAEGFVQLMMENCDTKWKYTLQEK